MLEGQITLRMAKSVIDEYKDLADSEGLKVNDVYRAALSVSIDTVRKIISERPEGMSFTAAVEMHQFKAKPKKKSTQTNRFEPPTYIEAVNYFEFCKCPESEDQAQRFIDFYSSKGWMVGKNKMKDWKGAIRNWMRRYEENRRNSGDELNKQLSDPSYAIRNF